MSKPSNVSQELWEATADYADELHTPDDYMHLESRKVIVRALMAERERCALEADSVADTYEAYGAFETANEFRQVAFAIRKGAA